MPDLPSRLPSPPAAEAAPGPGSPDSSPGEPLIAIEDPRPQGDPPRSARGRVLLGVSLVLIAFNLRPVFSSLSTVLTELTRSTGLGSAGASVLTTLPVLAMGMFSFPAPAWARRVGAERVILASLAVLAIGTGLRGLGTVPALLLGSLLAGGSIAMGNTLLPGLVKRDFPRRQAMMTGLYTMALCGGAAAAAGLTVPIEHVLASWQAAPASAGPSKAWPGALAVWAIPAAAMAVLWIPQTRNPPKASPSAMAAMAGLARQRLAWQVTLFMGLQSALAYIVFGWLAPILHERGLDSTTAGLAVSVSVGVQMVACLLTPPLASRGRDQRAAVVTVTTLAVGGLLGCIFAPIGSVWVWVVVQGLGQGGLIALATLLIILRSPDAHVAAKLSGMAQGVGYCLAAFGPLVAGLIHGWTGDFRATAALIVALGTVAGWNGWGAGRRGQIGEAPVRRS